MNYLDTQNGRVVARASADVRAGFIRKTYLHLGLAIVLFALLEAAFFAIGLHVLALKILSISSFAWLGVLLVYGFASSYVHRLAHHPLSKGMQYLALGLGVFLEALIFLPLLAMATLYAPDVLPQAVKITGVLVLAITAVAFVTGKDFSFLRGALALFGLIALGFIVVAVVFGISLGLWFSGAMIIFAGASILYETSKIQFHYAETDYVAASLSLFSAVGLLFFYVIQFLMQFSSSD